MGLQLYLVRHGRTEYNEAGRLQGWRDAPLTPQGRAVAEQLGKALGAASIVFDAAFASTSPRAETTARLILENKGQEDLPLHKIADLREYSFGSFEGELIADVYRQVAQNSGAQDVETWLANYRTAEHNLLIESVSRMDAEGKAETEAAFLSRLSQGMAELVSKSPEEGKVLLVSHGMAITALLKLIDPGSTPYQSVPNASVSRLDYENGVWRILSVGDTSFVGNSTPETL
ncbi:phosphoglycerate mutase [Neisseria arctica]|uniref:phosphoglycerate mutase (2,3-diphosphoglycerate-dependent) n=1 Tax=Neisseria arctica TaxID=1470200 RepID=A0A0J0YTN9_9NEIS|nr:histidine phosphatase family protein [Neisseria arctica]KLT73474.1 phosphoglycerate mutase [Neisseria arctica]UOO86139.1 histidine phosphatase family protein [Neisseria arctica]